MQHGRDVVVEVAVTKPRQELVLVHVVGDVAIDEVAEFVGVGEIVDGKDAGFAARVPFVTTEVGKVDIEL